MHNAETINCNPEDDNEKPRTARAAALSTNYQSIMNEPEILKAEVNDNQKDTLTVKFWRDGGYNGKPCTPNALWACHIGENYIEGIGGFGSTPLDALANLVENLGRNECHATDNGRILLR